MTRIAPLSAFAARKAVASVGPPRKISPDIVSENLDGTREVQPDGSHDEANTRPMKRRRTLKVARSLERPVDAVHHEPGTIRDTASNFSTEDPKPSAEDPTTFLNAEVSSDSEQDSSELEDHQSLIAAVRQLCTFNPSQKNVVAETDTKWTVRLGGEESLALVGQYDLCIIKGAVSIHGAVLHASSKLHRVYAPSTHAIPVIKAVVNPYGPHGQSAEIEIVSSKSRIRMLREISPDFGRIWNKPVEERGSTVDTTRRSFALMRTSADDHYRRPLYSLNPPANSQTLIGDILARDADKEQPAILVCGPKRSGKSTFCRSLINAIVTNRGSEPYSKALYPSTKPAVALLDIDPGQPEFALPGQMSLVELRTCILGPPFTHPEIDPSKGSKVVQLQCYGSLSPKDDPSHYLDCVLKLYESYRNLLQLHRNLLLVVNCSGWIHGDGLELLLHIIQRLRVSDVVYMSDGGLQEDLPGVLTKACSKKLTRLHTISSCPSQPVIRTASELRTMQTLSYFHLTEPEAGELRWNYKSLREMAPTVIHYSGPKQCILAVMVLGDEQGPDFLETILEGCLVDIVVVEDYAALPNTDDPSIEDGQQESQHHADTPEHLYHPSILRNLTSIPYVPAKNRTVRPLPPKYTHSLGQALIRSIDTQNHLFHLLMPVNFVLPRIRQHMKPIIVLVRGKLEMPTWAYKEQLELDKALRSRREEDLGVKEEADEDELRYFAESTPWASVVEGRRSAGARKRSVRRDLKYRSQVESEQ